MDFNNDKPIFLQISETIEDGILIGAFKEDEQVPSITEFSTLYKINPATANKGINLLVEENILYKKRGIGMFVSKGATKKIANKRQGEFYKNYVQSMIKEAKKLHLTPDDIIAMIERSFENE